MEASCCLVLMDVCTFSLEMVEKPGIHLGSMATHKTSKVLQISYEDRVKVEAEIFHYESGRLI